VQNAIPPSAIANTINICAQILVTQQVGDTQEVVAIQKAKIKKVNRVEVIVWELHSPFTLANFSIVSLVFIFRCSSTTTNPVCERRVNLLVYSLSLHRHSYIGFILAFASSFHNKHRILSLTFDLLIHNK
jgi:hypothetical protein